MFDRNMLIVFAVEEDRPQLTQGFLGGAPGTEDCVADPESERPRGVIGSQKETFIVPPGLTMKAGVIDLLVEGL